MPLPPCAPVSAPNSAPQCLTALLSFAYPGQPPLLLRWQARLGAGVTWLQGDTGSGKTTLLRLLAGELHPQQGQVTLGLLAWPGDGAAYQKQVLSSDAAWLHDEQLTATTLAERLAKTQAAFDAAAWAAHLAGFGLAPHLAKPMLAMSSGSRHKLRLAAVLSANAALTLIDEPSAGLDAPSLRHLLASLAAAHVAAGRVVVVAGGLGPAPAPEPAPPWPVLSLPAVG